MAEIISNNSNRNTGRKLHSTRVDLTPMVDLGFLLITFFIFTTTLSTSTVMNLALPKDSNDSMFVAKSGAVSLVATKEAVVLVPAVAGATAQSFRWNEKAALRSRLLSIRQQLITSNGNDDKLFVMIKPMSDAVFGQVVDLFDEMTICNIRRYALTEPDAADEKFLATIR